MDQSLVVIKLHVNDEIRRFSAPRNASFAQLIHLIRTVMGFAPDCKLGLKYSDAEGDICTVASDPELAEALRNFPTVLNMTLAPPPLASERNIPKNSLVPASEFSSRKNQLEQSFASKVSAPAKAAPFKPAPFKPISEAKIPQKPVLGSSLPPKKPNRALELESQGLALMNTDLQAAHNIFHHQLRISDPSNTQSALFNIACCNSALGKTDSALSFLCRAIDAGFNDWIRLAKEPYLNNLRSMDSFNALAQFLCKEQVLVAEFGADHTGQLINSELHITSHRSNLFTRACKASHDGKPADAIRLIELALLSGFFNYKELMSHPDFAVFANEEHFKKLVNRAATNFNAKFPQSKVELPFPEFASSPVELKEDNHEIFHVKEDVEPREVDVDVAMNMQVLQEMALSEPKGDKK
jgi:hypothetical protein